MKKKIKISKTTESFKEQFICEVIVPTLNFKGAKMLFPYHWNGERRFASIGLHKIIKAIKWDVKPYGK